MNYTHSKLRDINNVYAPRGRLLPSKNKVV